MPKYSSEPSRDLGQPPVPAALQTVLAMIGSGEASSRALIARVTGLARSTVSQQVDALIALGIVEEQVISESVRGRPPRRLSISPGAGTIAVVDVDATATQVAIADLSGAVVARGIVRMPVDRGPEELLGAVVDEIRSMLAAHELDPCRVRQVVAGLPAPVDFQRGRVVRPPIMPGWDGYAVGDHLREAFKAPVVVDNDVNLMALGVAAQEQTDTPLLFVKVAAGIGAGIVTDDGVVLRGADGAAGDIGHIRTSVRRDVVCQCGKLDCLESVASYRAVLAALGIDSAPTDDPRHASRELARLIADSDAQALFRIRQAATDLGEVIAMLIHTLNPRTLVLGGPLSELHDEVLSGVRAAVYERALPLATRKLTITTSQLGADAGIAGAVVVATREVFSAEGMAQLLSAPRG
ncbi:ROK family transcriptional regulator [Streptomyces sp. NPDC056390]|uniref:ROK family transcriptional regulator n=1 Tax=Streptomyces sp. NPDC056390 TaxID=3345806 RepID=UPI0035E040EF